MKIKIYEHNPEKEDILTLKLKKCDTTVDVIAVDSAGNEIDWLVAFDCGNDAAILINPHPDQRLKISRTESKRPRVSLDWPYRQENELVEKSKTA